MVRSNLVVLGIVLSVLTYAPVHASTLNESLKLTAPDAQAGDLFGISVGISGTTAIVGAEWDDDAGRDAGSAYIIDTTTGNQIAKLTASDADHYDQFGWSADISGNTAIVGSVFDDDGAFKAGSAYLFDATTGTQIAKLTAPDPGAADLFGYSVAIDSGQAIVGALQHNGAYVGSGAAYLFDATTGALIREYAPNDPGLGDKFGTSVAMSGNTAIIGASLDDGVHTDSGSAYVFDVTTGNQLLKLTASDPSERQEFGHSVAISGNIAVVGARDSYSNNGYAYIFDISTGNELFKLASPYAENGNYFGWTVATNGDVAIVGALYDDRNTDGAGRAYVYDTSTGDLLYELSASDRAPVDQFGMSMAISGDTVIIGASTDDDAGDKSGSAYVFNNIPEPASLSLVLAGSIALMRRTGDNAYV
tara:strand:- start:602 stop:1858 length:1257 start_codon:yes stop_codon:yes gene_type:complete